MELSPVFPLREESSPSSIDSVASPLVVPVNEILKGVIAFVEVRAHAENRSRAIAAELEELGAVVSYRLNSSVTHVIFREGRKRTKDWAYRHSVPLVSVGWIQACKRASRKISESHHPAIQSDSGTDDGSPSAALQVAMQGRRRVRSMQPKDMDEELKLSADRKRRAARRNAKRDALHRRVVEAENCLRSFEGETSKNYYADPCIRVPKTPPSMKEYTERMERRRISPDSETTFSSRRSSIPKIISNKPSPRRRLFESPVEDPLQSCQKQLLNRSRCESPGLFPYQSAEESVQESVPGDALADEVTPKMRRRLFNASAFEASGILIEPKHSSNRLQNISSVFPKSFRKRNILPQKKNVKRKTVPMVKEESGAVDENESFNSYDELNFVRVTKSRRLSMPDTGTPKTCASSSTYELGVPSPVVPKTETFDNDDEYSATICRRLSMPGLGTPTTCILSPINEPASDSSSITPKKEPIDSVSEKHLREGEMETEEVAEVCGTSNDVSDKSKLDHLQNDILDQSSGCKPLDREMDSDSSFDIATVIQEYRGKRRKVISKGQEDFVPKNDSFNVTNGTMTESSRQPLETSNTADVLEVIDRSTQFREALKRPTRGCRWSDHRRKSVRFSDSKDEENTRTLKEVPEAECRPQNEIQELSGRMTTKNVRRQSNLAAPNVANGGNISSQGSSEGEPSKDKRTSSSFRDILSESEKTVANEKTPSSLSTSSLASPKRRRSSRLMGLNPFIAKGIRKCKSLSSTTGQSVTEGSSCASNVSSVVRAQSRRSCPDYKRAVHLPPTNGTRNRRSRLSYSEEQFSDGSKETAYGVLDIPQPKPTSKRYSVVSVVDALVNTNETSGNESIPTPTSSQTSTKSSIRPSLADFKLYQKSPKVRNSKGHKKVTAKMSSGKDTVNIAEKCRSVEKFHKIVFTSLHQNQQTMAKKVMNILGNARLYQSVTSSTTHVVTSWPIRRTLNLLRGILFGCQIVSLSWILESHEAGKWLPEKNYKVNEVPGPEQQPKIRQLFKDFKEIYVDQSVTPPQRDLKELIRLAGGKITTSSQSASVVVSSQSGESTGVSPKWILDSIMESEALPLDEYQAH